MWYFIQDNEKKGRFSREEMESFSNQGDINENTLVWKKGMKDWQPLIETELKDILPEDMPPPIPSDLPPPFPTTYGKVQEESIEKISLPTQAPTSQDDTRIKLLHNAKARIWAHWLFWLFIPYIGGIISVAKTKSLEDNEPSGQEVSGQAVIALILPVLMAMLPQIFANWYVSLLYFVNVISGAYKTQEIIEKARNQLNIKDPLQAEKLLLSHF